LLARDQLDKTFCCHNSHRCSAFFSRLPESVLWRYQTDTKPSAHYDCSTIDNFGLMLLTILKVLAIRNSTNGTALIIYYSGHHWKGIQISYSSFIKWSVTSTCNLSFSPIIKCFHYLFSNYRQLDTSFLLQKFNLVTSSEVGL
jgi:hypothetical protein